MADGYLRHIRACNVFDRDGFRPLRIAGQDVGLVRHDTADTLCRLGRGIFQTAEDGRLALAAGLASAVERTQAVQAVLARAAEAGHIPPHHGESYAVVMRWGEPPLLTVDRAHAAVLGIPAFGLHVNGYVYADGETQIWLARRAADRPVSPGKLDNLVGGGQPAHLTLEENLRKEGAEEASLTAEDCAKARPVGAVSYIMAVDAGLRRDVLFLYDLPLEPGFTPVNTDGEVDAFVRQPMAAVAARVRDTDDFKFNVNLVLIDFLIRHGFIRPDDPGYLDLVRGLHR